MKHTSQRSARFWLFAPFIGLSILTILYGALWLFLSREIPARLNAAGLTFAQNTSHGFPARLSFDIDSPAYQDPSIGWATDAVRLDLMPYNAEHAVLRFPQPHEITTSLGKVTIDHSTNIASLTIGLNGLRQFDFILTKPELSGYLGDVSLRARADNVDLHTRQNPSTPEQADMVADAEQVQIGRQEIFDQIKLTALMPQKWFAGRQYWADGLRAGAQVDITSLSIRRADFECVARGALGADAQGRLKGRLTLDLSDIAQFVDMLARGGIIDARMRRDILLVNGFAKFFNPSGTPQKISVPLKFENGIATLANIPIGRAPRLPLP